MQTAWITNIPQATYEAALKEFHEEIRFQRELLRYLKEYIEQGNVQLQEYTKCTMREQTNQLHILFFYYIETEMKKQNIEPVYVTLKELI